VRADGYPFGRARSTFFLGGAGDGPLPAGRPLLAYGANASPEALERKLPDMPVAALAGRLRGFAVVHSAHLSPYGAVPATLVPDPHADEEVHVLLAAASDEARLDATEPNYRRVWLRGIDLVIDRLGRLDAVEAYVSRHGPLVDGGRPVALGARPQDELRALLGRSQGRRRIVTQADAGALSQA
jgi:hypothetical protein